MQERIRELDLRIETLERTARRVTRCAALASFGALALGLVSMRAVCDTVSAERFVLVDPQGRERAVWTAYETGGAPRLTLLDAQGRALATLATDAQGAYLTLTDARGEKGVRYAVPNDAEPSDSAPGGAKPREEKPKPRTARVGLGEALVAAQIR